MWAKLNISQRNFSILSNKKIIYDVVVVGGGHAGCEGAASAARCGATTLLITHKKSTIGEMSCNPSFGGIGKGHLIREIDALDGLCGKICDKSAITYQALNRSKGPAVLGLRAQIDRKLYRKAMQEEILTNTPNLKVIEGSVEDLSLEISNVQISSKFTHRIKGCFLADGTEILTKCILITTGTFLNGEIFLGLESRPAGRINDPASIGLSKTFNRLGFELGRLRTKTPPRLIGSTIDFTKFQIVPPDPNPIPFSFLTKNVWLSPDKQLPTYIGHTNHKTKQIVLDNLHENLYLEAEIHGPRNCPSLESRVIKFPDLIHRIYLEHEGLDTNIIYPQSMSLSFSSKVQLEIMRSITGLEKVEFQQPGYGVHYDFVNPQQLQKTLETKKVEGLFLAGQINGTTGYEEAAAQGILAGINSALKAKDYIKGPLLIDRSQGYIGVMVDDLTSLGTIEPYRMFTSKAEFRLNLRPDNADFRLTDMGNKLGAISMERYNLFTITKERYKELEKRLKSILMVTEQWNKVLPHLNATDKVKKMNGVEILSKYPFITLKQISQVYPELLKKFADDLNLEERIRNAGRYAIYQTDFLFNIETMRKETQTLLPEDLDYLNMNELTISCRENLNKFRPQNIAAASRIPGVTIEVMIHLLRYAKISNNLKNNYIS